MALKHGYTNVDDYKNGVQKKFSLLEAGILDKPSTRLLLINVSASDVFTAGLTKSGNSRWTDANRGLDTFIRSWHSEGSEVRGNALS